MDPVGDVRRQALAVPEVTMNPNRNALQALVARYREGAISKSLVSRCSVQHLNVHFVGCDFLRRHVPRHSL